MLFRLIESIRKKPKETRQLFAFAVSGGITLVIFGVWLVSYTAYVSTRLGSDQGLLSFGTDEVAKAGETIANGYSNIKDAKDELVPSNNNLASVLEADILSGIVASTSASTTAASSTAEMKPQKASSTATTSSKKLVE